VIDAVLDANTLASGSVASHGTIALLINAFLADELRVFLSPQIVRELERTLAKPYFARKLTAEAVADYLTTVRLAATLVEITAEVHGVATHPEDDLVLATALSAGVSYLVTGDIQLQELGVYQQIHIVSPRAFLDALAAEEGAQ
jgi:putative PIN family toxin of toxin-antitoxin system